jgi:DNA gyrase/topoisomerase IV subunit A
MKFKHQPIDVLPLYAETVDGMLEVSTEQLRNLYRMMRFPQELDDDTVDQILQLYTQQLMDHWLLEAQCKHWHAQGLNEEQTQVLNRLLEQTSALKRITEEILKVARFFDDYRFKTHITRDISGSIDTASANV